MDKQQTTATEDSLKNNEAYVAGRGRTSLPTAPSKSLAVVACMDSRLDIFRILGLGEGEAHIIRNAGGIVTEDVIRSLIISQRLLGTKEIVLIHHTECGMLMFRDEEMRAQIASEVGYRPLFSFQPFGDLHEDVRDGMSRIRHSPFLQHRNVRGFVFDVTTGQLDEVS